jgi:hypothetical protein
MHDVMEITYSFAIPEYGERAELHCQVAEFLLNVFKKIISNLQIHYLIL